MTLYKRLYLPQMKFINSPLRIHSFYDDFRNKKISSIKDLYTLNQLKLIAQDLSTAIGLSTSQLVLETNDIHHLIVGIKQIVSSWAYLDDDDEDDPLTIAYRAFQRHKSGHSSKSSSKSSRKASSKAPENPRMVMTKSYSDMKASELRSEAAALNLDSSGVKNRLLQRLVKYDRDQLDFEDMSTDWLRSKLEEEKVIVPKSRKGMIEILIRADADEMELGDFNDWVLNHYWDEFKTRYDLPSKNGVTRTEKLKQLRTLQIKELKQKCRELDRKLYECQHQKRPTVYRTHHSRPTGDSVVGSLARGVLTGMAAGIVSNIITKRRLQSKSNLIF